MSSASTKASAERHQRILLELLKQPGNQVCADCRTRNPRWASWNLGIFICVKCAGVHRKMGTHISKVKSVTLDSWTKEQTEQMKRNGNVRSNQYYNPQETRHPLPTDFDESERDSQLEKYIMMKYKYKRFVDLDGNGSGSSVHGSGSSTASFGLCSSSSASFSPTSSACGLPTCSSASSPPRSLSVAGQRSKAVVSPPTRSITPAGDRLQSSGPGINFSLNHPRSFYTACPPETHDSAPRQLGDHVHLAHRPASCRSPRPGVTQVAPPVPNLPAAYKNLGSSLMSNPFSLATHTGQNSLQSTSSTQLIAHNKSQPNVQAPSTCPTSSQSSDVWNDLMQLENPSSITCQVQNMNLRRASPAASAFNPCLVASTNAPETLQGVNSASVWPSFSNTTLQAFPSPPKSLSSTQSNLIGPTGALLSSHNSGTNHLACPVSVPSVTSHTGSTNPFSAQHHPPAFGSQPFMPPSLSNNNPFSMTSPLHQQHHQQINTNNPFLKSVPSSSTGMTNQGLSNQFPRATAINRNPFLSNTFC